MERRKGTERRIATRRSPSSICVLNYSIDALIKIIANTSGNDELDISNKHHISYFETYLDKIEATTLVVERDYVDRDYLEDYSYYYVRCFTSYEKRCTRIHFFNNNFNENSLFQCIENTSDSTSFYEELKDAYLGFIVIKPLPFSVFGRTCLKSYPEYENGSKRLFPALRTYTANLCGIDLQIESLAFQEQDKTVSACATSALWTVFQGTSQKFHHKNLSPVEITKAATDQFPDNTRTFPNNGLTFEMIAQGIRYVGLEPYTQECDEYALKANIYAYLKARIPIFLGFHLYKIKSTKVKQLRVEHDGVELVSEGLHAVAVTGVNINGEPSTEYDNGRLHMSSCYIDKLFVHDDQVGPFARMSWIKKSENKLAWGAYQGSDYQYLAVPMLFTVPLHNKIRIPYEYIYFKIEKLNKFIELYKYIFTDRVKWDIYLSLNNDYKSRLSKESDVIDKKIVLLTPLPRHLWVCEVYDNADEKILELIFDATDVENGSCFIMAVMYNENTKALLEALSIKEDFLETARVHEVNDIISWFGKPINFMNVCQLD